MYVREERHIQDYAGENLRERDHLGDPGVDWRIILRWIFKKIGREGPTPWPPRSPDITPLDFFLWGYVKDTVFSTPVPDITNLKARTTDAFAAITGDMLENTWRETDYRLDVLRATKAAHVEVY